MKNKNLSEADTAFSRKNTMKNLSLSFILCLSFLTAQAQQMSFKSSNAATHSLVVADKSIYSANNATVTFDPGVIAPPISGAGTRLMWLPSKSAFRVGSVNGIQWNAANIGTWSMALGESLIASGNNSTAFGSLTNASGFASTAMGNSTTASGYVSTAMGNSTTASGYVSTAMGESTTAFGFNSTAMGESTTASGSVSTAMGYNTTASGPTSTAMGAFTIASGIVSTSMGISTTAQAYGSLAIGRYNIVSGSVNSWIPTEPVFVIGNGTFETPSNALTVLKNGRTAIGFEAPESMLHVKKGDSGVVSFYAPSNLNVESNTNNYISLLNPNATESGILFGNPTSSVDGGVIYNNTAATRGLQFRTNGNITRMTLSNTGNLTVTGSVTASCGLLICSDARYKKNITGLDNSLDNILKINGVRYNLRQSDFPEKNFSDKNQIGFIAQDLEKIFPEMVFTDEKGYKSVDYGRLTPVLVEAVKELSAKNEALKNKNEKIEARLEKLEALLLKTDADKMVTEK